MINPNPSFVDLWIGGWKLEPSQVATPNPPFTIFTKPFRPGSSSGILPSIGRSWYLRAQHSCGDADHRGGLRPAAVFAAGDADLAAWRLDRRGRAGTRGTKLGGDVRERIAKWRAHHDLLPTIPWRQGGCDPGEWEEDILRGGGVKNIQKWVFTYP